MAKSFDKQKKPQGFFKKAANRFGRLVRGIVSIPLLVAATAVATVGYAIAGLVVPIVVALSASSPSGSNIGASSNKSIPEKESVLDKLYRYSKDGLTLGGKFEEKAGAGTNFVTGVGQSVGYAVGGAFAGAILGSAGGPIGAAVGFIAGATAGAVAGVAITAENTTQLTQARARLELESLKNDLPPNSSPTISHSATSQMQASKTPGVASPQDGLQQSSSPRPQSSVKSPPSANQSKPRPSVPLTPINLVTDPRPSSPFNGETVNYPDNNQIENYVATPQIPNGGMEYKFYTSKDASPPYAVLSNESSKLKEGESKEDNQKRKAITLIDMVDKILATGEKELNIGTSDPFALEIIKQHVQQLQSNGKAVSATYKFKGTQIDDNHEFDDLSSKEKQEQARKFMVERSQPTAPVIVNNNNNSSSVTLIGVNGATVNVDNNQASVTTNSNDNVDISNENGQLAINVTGSQAQNNDVDPLNQDLSEQSAPPRNNNQVGSNNSSGGQQQLEQAINMSQRTGELTRDAQLHESQTTNSNATISDQLNNDESNSNNVPR